MTTAERVAVGLRTLVSADGIPSADTFVFRHRLLDHGGGDARAHVMLIERALAWGIPSRLGAPPDTADEWSARRLSIARQFAADHFVVTEAALWTVDTWALALGVVPERWVAVAPLVADAVPPGVPKAQPPLASGNAATVTPPRSIAPRRGPASPVGMRVAPVPRRIRHRASSGPGISARNAVTVLLGTAVVLATVVGAFRAVDAARDTPRPTSSVAEVTALPAATTSVDSPRRDGISGTYDVQPHVISIEGDPACGDPNEITRMEQRTRETIEVADDGIQFRLSSRPGVVGRVGPNGELEVSRRVGQTRGTRWAFAMRGRAADGRLIASTDLVIEASLPWRQVRRCRIQTDLVGVLVR
jgi:hypothetical protein